MNQQDRNQILCEADSLCPMQAKHVVFIKFDMWKDENGYYGRIKSIPTCDTHVGHFERVGHFELLPGQTAIKLVSVTKNALKGEDWQR